VHTAYQESQSLDPRVALLEISRNTFVLIDQSTNGTFVRTAEGEELCARHDSLKLKGQGMVGLGCLPEQCAEMNVEGLVQLAFPRFAPSRREPLVSNSKSAKYVR
jgi:hypothetical protein